MRRLTPLVLGLALAASAVAVASARPPSFCDRHPGHPNCPAPLPSFVTPKPIDPSSLPSPRPLPSTEPWDGIFPTPSPR